MLKMQFQIYYISAMQNADGTIRTIYYFEVHDRMWALNFSRSARTSSSGLYIKSLMRHICMNFHVQLPMQYRSLFFTMSYVSKYDETRETFAFTCKVPPPPVFPQSSETLTMVHGSHAFQWKSTTLSLHARQQNGSEMGI